MTNSLLHYNKLQEALKKKKLIVLQYSCTNLNDEKKVITSVFAIDYFKDKEYSFLGNDKQFNSKLSKFFKDHLNYFFLIWNYNIYYGPHRFNLVVNKKSLNKILDHCIDFDDALEMYGQKRGEGYIQKVSGGFDSRYYLALLNNIKIIGEWINGKTEISVKNYSLLKASSRTKTKVMVKLLDLFKSKTLIVKHDEMYIEKSKEILKPKKLIQFKIFSNYYSFFLTFKKIILFLIMIIGLIASLMTIFGVGPLKMGLLHGEVTPFDFYVTYENIVFQDSTNNPTYNSSILLIFETYTKSTSRLKIKLKSYNFSNKIDDYLSSNINLPSQSLDYIISMPEYSTAINSEYYNFTVKLPIVLEKFWVDPIYLARRTKFDIGTAIIQVDLTDLKTNKTLSKTFDLNMSWDNEIK